MNPFEKVETSKLKDFWVAWRQLVADFGGRNFLCEHFPSQCGDGHPTYFDDNLIQKKLYVECGNINWPRFPEQPPRRWADLPKLVEFMFRFVSKPTESWFHSWCGADHPTEFDAKAGRYEYTVAVNKLFANFGFPCQLRKGRILPVSSPLLDRAILELELETRDEHLRKLLATAINEFQKADISSRHHALRAIVDAFERLKTIKGADKRKSTEQVLHELSTEDEVLRAFDEDLRKLTQIANSFCIRHHEIDKIPLEDSDMLEFLFYLYFNYVRLILKKHNLLKAAG